MFPLGYFIQEDFRSLLLVDGKQCQRAFFPATIGLFQSCFFVVPRVRMGTSTVKTAGCALVTNDTNILVAFDSQGVFFAYAACAHMGHRWLCSYPLHLRIQEDGSASGREETVPTTDLFASDGMAFQLTFHWSERVHGPNLVSVEVRSYGPFSGRVSQYYQGRIYADKVTQTGKTLFRTIAIGERDPITVCRRFCVKQRAGFWFF